MIVLYACAEMQPLQRCFQICVGCKLWLHYGYVFVVECCSELASMIEVCTMASRCECGRTNLDHGVVMSCARRISGAYLTIAPRWYGCASGHPVGAKHDGDCSTKPRYGRFRCDHRRVCALDGLTMFVCSNATRMLYWDAM